MIPFNSQANYFEIFITPSLIGKTYEDEASEFDIGLNYEQFTYLMSLMSKSEYKCFQKQYKQYIYDNIIVHNYKNVENRVFKNTPVIIEKNDKAIMIGYKRNKLTFLSAPCTKNIYEISYVKKLIFRVNNRIFVNFQCNLIDNKKIYYVYINYNHESNIDQDSITETLKKILDIFKVNTEFNLLMESTD